MKFAHMADCHIGSWRDPKLKDASSYAFSEAVKTCIEENVDFVIIAGDLFNTSFPRLDSLKSAVTKLKDLKDAGIPVYIVPGSHDYSPSGKTILDVLEEAGLFVNVFRGSVENGKLRLNFTIDKKTGVKLTGMLGKRGSLEKLYYEKMITEHLENEQGCKIFVFHSGIDEIKQKGMENIISQPLSMLPKNFDYYAGGHVHIVDEKTLEGYKKIAYPGPLFPNSFSELEKLEAGGFYIVEDGKTRWERIQAHNVYKIPVDCSGKTADEIKKEVLEDISNKEFNNTIVLIRLRGVMEGRPSDIDFRDIFSKIYEKSAYFVMKSSSQLSSKTFDEIKIDMRSVDDVEASLIREHSGQMTPDGMSKIEEESIIKSLMELLNSDRDESERVADFEKRIKEDLGKVLGIRL